MNATERRRRIRSGWLGRSPKSLGSKKWGFVAAVACALALGSTDAHAQSFTPWSQSRTSEKAATEIRAKELFQKGDAAYAEGRYEEALAAFQESYDISGRPQLLFNVSNALERLGRYAEAVEALEKYLASGKARDKDVVQKRLAAVKKRAEEQKREEEKKAKDEEDRKKAEAEERRKAEERAAASGQSNPTKPDEPKPKPMPILPIALTVGGGVLLVTGGVFAAMTLSARGEASDGCKDGPGGTRCSADASSALDREKTFGLVADIGILSGLVVGGIGIYLLVTHKPFEPKASVGSTRFVPRAGGGGLEVAF